MLAWMTLGLLASAGMGHTDPQAQPQTNPQAQPQTDRLALAACHGAAPAQSGEPARDATPSGPELPCQWALPLLCCQQPAAADASSPGLVKLAALWLHVIDPLFAPLPPALRVAPVALEASTTPPLERSVVLQV